MALASDRHDRITFRPDQIFGADVVPRMDVRETGERTISSRIAKASPSRSMRTKTFSPDPEFFDRLTDQNASTC